MCIPMQPPSIPPQLPSSPPQLPAAPPANRGRWMTLIFNVYLVSFTAEGLFVLASPVLGNIPHSILGTVALLFMMLVILCIGSFKQLPWRPLAPALFLSLWQGCLYLPLPAYLDVKPLLFAAGAAHLSVGLNVFFSVRRATGGASFPFQQRQWTDCTFSFSRTILAGALKLFVLTPGLLLYLAWSAQLMLQKMSHGFLQIDSTGLYTEAREYEKDAQKIHLLPTVHVAAPAFYDKLMEALPSSQSVILPEGVTDKKHLMKARLDYSVAADSLGLSTQPDLTEKHKGPATQACDADISDFSAPTVALLNGVAGILQAASAGNTLGALESLATFENIDTMTVIDDIIRTRNMRVVEGVRTALQTHQHVAIPWGAAHMPGIESEILKMNFQRGATRRVMVFGWKDLKFPSEP